MPVWTEQQNGKMRLNTSTLGCVLLWLLLLGLEVSLDRPPQCHYVPRTKPSGSIPLDVLEEERLSVKKGLREDLHQVAAPKEGYRNSE